MELGRSAGAVRPRRRCWFCWRRESGTRGKRHAMARLLCPPALVSEPSCVRLSVSSTNTHASPGASPFASQIAPAFSRASRIPHRLDNSAICSVRANLSHTEAELKSEPVDVVILTNGPGEVATWVKPVVAKLRRTAEDSTIDMRISVVLAPCPHASGGELQLLQSFDEIDRCQGPEGFFSLLLLGRTQDGWDWRKRGVCIFLGGDQFNTLVLGWRLGYKTLIYAEDAARWPGYVLIRGWIYATFTRDHVRSPAMGSQPLPGCWRSIRGCSRKFTLISLLGFTGYTAVSGPR